MPLLYLIRFLECQAKQDIFEIQYAITSAKSTVLTGYYLIYISIELWSTIWLFLEGQKLFLWILVLGSLIKKWIRELTGDSREKLGKLLAFLHSFQKKHVC